MSGPRTAAAEPGLVLVGDADERHAHELSRRLRAVGIDSVAMGRFDTLPRVVAERAPDLILTEASASSPQLVREVRRLAPGARLVLMAAHPTVAEVVAGIRAGADDFVEKPVPVQHIADELRLHCAGRSDVDIVCASAASAACFDLAARVAGTDVSVMINGESGTGKEVVARFIHANSTRADGPFIAINCAAIPEQMLEATLFGFDKGAFTGAHKAKEGKFEIAEGGTLLLDEISEMALSLQAKLLRVLQEREVERVGSNLQRPVDVRVIATSNRDLGAALAAGEFREDLYYRLSVFPLTLEPLRRRVEDIAPLARFFLHKYRRLAGATAVEFSTAAMTALESHQWPGNVRELENTVQRALVMCRGQSLDVADVGLGAVAASPTKLADEVQQKEFDTVLRTLQREGGARVPTAKALGISERTLRYKLNRMRQLGVLPE